MKFELPSGRKCRLIGDPHLGKKFEVGVPIHRRGDRERRQFDKFVAALNDPCDVNIMVGDLFDHPYVGYGVVTAAATAYLEAAQTRPDTVFAAMAGNHDLPRNLSVVSAWDAFEKILAGRLPNLIVVRKPYQIEEIMLFPWEWGVSSVEQIENACLNDTTVAVGHWDLQSYGGDDSHMVPVSHLKGMTLYSGHYHTPGDYKVDGQIVHCTGSLEPYSHGEDPDGEIYVTLTLAEATDGRDLSEKCVRVILENGEELPTDLDCFAIAPLKAKSQADQVDQVTLDGFDWNALLTEALKPLDPEVRAFISERITG